MEIWGGEKLGSWRIVAQHLAVNYHAIVVTAKALKPQGLNIGRMPQGVSIGR